MSIAAVVLAAGEATRFGSPKQRLLLPDVLARIEPANLDDVVVVAGAYDLDPGSARLVRCADWAKGPGASLRCGLAALGPDVEAAVVLLSDGPDVSAASVQRVVDGWRAGDKAEIVAASYAGARGHPLLLPRPRWADVPDEGLRGRPARLVPCDDLGRPGDVDTPADLPRRLR